MITQTHDQLDVWVSILTLVTGGWGIAVAIRAFTNRGWLKAEQLEKTLLADTIAALKATDAALKATDHIQFTRLDEVKAGLAACVTREMHDRIQRELTDRIDRLSINLSTQLTEGFAQVNTRIDHLADRGPIT
jgi:hypothetical protein